MPHGTKQKPEIKKNQKVQRKNHFIFLMALIESSVNHDNLWKKTKGAFNISSTWPWEKNKTGIIF
jgi:hypothetical protein